MMATVVNPAYFDPTRPGWYIRCEDAVVGPFKTRAAAEARRDAIQSDASACPHAHTVVPVGLHDDTASGTVKP